ncbi:DUF87 domain-containing protein [Clostridium sp. AM58-1XD]|nr:DUF87 domain-containing protein [Clostridium sp. AM58-1XD]
MLIGSQGGESMYDDISKQKYHIENEVLDELQSLFSHYRTLDRSPDDITGGKAEETVRETLEEINRLPEGRIGLEDMELCSLRMLGRSSERDDKKEKTAQLGAARSIASLGRSFSLSYIVTERGESMCRIGLSGKNAERIIGSSLRGAFGQVKLEPAEQTEKKGAEYTAIARCRLAYQDRNAMEQQDSSELMESVIDAAAAALPDDPCSLEIRFDPLDIRWVEERERELRRLQDILNEYAQTSWQVSANTGANVNVSEGLPRQVVENLQGRTNQSDSSGISVSLSASLRQSLAEAAANEAGYRLEQMNHIKRSGGWSVTVTAKAEDEGVLEALEAAASGAFFLSGLSVTWDRIKPYRRTEASAILEGDRIHSMFRLPEHHFPGFQRIENRGFALEAPTLKEGDRGVEIGRVMWNEKRTARSFALSLSELNRHAFICGMTGSGKTNTVCGLLEQLDLPFLVIEPVKGEYRSLGLPDTEVYTMEAETEETLSINLSGSPMEAI